MTAYQSVDHDEGDSPTDDIYPTAEAFVTDYIAATFLRAPHAGLAWCPDWFRHPEAVERFHALWLAWEDLNRQGGTGPSSWFVYHWKTHADALFDPAAGPFSKCRAEDGHTEKMQPLPTAPMPRKASHG